MILKNCRIVSQRGITNTDIIVSGKKIKRVGKASGEGTDLKGLFVFPGAIDPHVHLRDPGSPKKEDFYTGTCAALAGGFTTVMDMPEYANPPTTTAKALREKESLARKKAVCDYHIRFGATKDNFDEIKKASPGSLKIFTAETNSPMTITDFGVIAQHFKRFPRSKPICIHSEEQEAIDHFSERYSNHCKVRSPIAAALSLSKILALQKVYKRRIHICHLSSNLELELISGRSRDVTFEVTPHHLFLSTRDYKKLGPYGKMNPPLRSRSDVSALWKNINRIDMIGTDHAPHTIKEKESENPPSGVPGLETAIPLLIDAAFKKRLKINRIPVMCSLNPARAFNIKNKGEIKAGYDADFFVVDPKGRTVVNGEELQTKCKWSPFEGKKLKGKIKSVFLRGEEVYRDDEGILVGPGFGKKAL